MSSHYFPGAGAPGDSQGNHRRPKAVLQREYRKREDEVLTVLRDIIKQLTDHSPQTRHDVLSEASQLLKQLGDENVNLKLQLSVILGGGGSSMVPPVPPAPPAHTVPAYGQGEVSWAATHSSTTSSTQIPHMFPLREESHNSTRTNSTQTPALDVFMTRGSMPEIEKLMDDTAEEMRAAVEEMQRSSSTHPDSQYYRK